MTTPAQPEQSATGSGAPATGEQTPGQQSTEPQQQSRPLGRADASTEPKPSDGPEPKKPATGEDGPDWKARAREWESRSKANKQQLTQYEQQLAAMRKALGVEGDDEEDLSEHAQRKLAEAEKAREAAEAERDEIKAEIAYEKAVTRIARTVNADPEALLDSDSFRSAVLGELNDDGFDDDELAKAVTKVAKEFAKKPRFAKTSTPARSGADMPAGGESAAPRRRPTSLTDAVRTSYGGN